MIISNQYKDIFEDLVDSLDIEFSNMSRPVDKGPCNVMPSSEDSLTGDKLDKNILDKSQWQ